MLMVAYTLYCYEIEVCMMFPWIYDGLWICWMWDHGKDMIMQVDDVYLVCLTHYNIKNEVKMKGYSHLNLKSLWSSLYKELISYDIW